MNKVIYQEISHYKYKLPCTQSYMIPLLGFEILTDYISIEKNGKITIRKGYAWNGASGVAVDTPNSIRGSLFHDALYQLIRQGHLPESLREKADIIFRDTCREDGMSNFRSGYFFYGVRVFGGRYARKGIDPFARVNKTAP